MGIFRNSGGKINRKRRTSRMMNLRSTAWETATDGGGYYQGAEMVWSK